jgi:hypothetical protein
MKATLTRYHSDNAATLGLLKVAHINHQPLFTLENPWKDNARNVSCIPAGTYQCKPFNGEKFKNVYEVCNVPGRSAILIHVGNYEKDTSGCVLVGLGVDPARSAPMIMKSTNAMHMLRGLIGGNDFELEVVNGLA